MKFEVGNKVYCRYHYATGTITDIKDLEISPYTICVTFEDGTTDTYTKQGKRIKSGPFCLELIEKVEFKKESEFLDFENVEGLGKVFTLSCGTRILKTLENTHIILPQTSNL